MGIMNFPDWVLKENHSVQCAFLNCDEWVTERNIMVLTVGVLKNTLIGIAPLLHYRDYIIGVNPIPL